MSFSRDAKLEAMQTSVEQDCCKVSFLAGIIRACGEIKKQDDGYSIVIMTDIQEIYNYINEIMHSLYGEYLELEIGDDFKISKSTYYKFKFPKNDSVRILEDIYMLKRENGNYKITYDLDDSLLIEEHCKRAFLKGAFIGASTSSIKIGETLESRTSTGYHLEFTSHSYEFLLVVSKVLSEFNILAKLVKRKNIYVLYLKDVEQITDLLAIVEANKSVLDLNNEIIAREFRNKVNRETNCLNANISKTVEASLKQTEAIQKINSTIGLEALPEDLQEVAVLRLANPEESLDELIKLSNIKLTRSGLNHRFKKLIKIADLL